MQKNIDSNYGFCKKTIVSILIIVIMLSITIYLYRLYKSCDELPYSCYHICFSPDGKILCSTDYQWNLGNDRIIREGVTVRAFSPDGKYYADIRANLYKSSDNQKELTEDGAAMAFSQNNSFYAYCRGKKNSISYPPGRVSLSLKMGSSVIAGAGEAVVFDLMKNEIIGKIDLLKVIVCPIIAFLEPKPNETLLVICFSGSHEDIELDEILDWQSFMNRLKKHSALPDKRIWNLLNEESKTIINCWESGTEPDEESRIIVLKGINGILHEENFYEPSYFIGLRLNESLVKEIDEMKEIKSNTVYANRELMELIFPKELLKQTTQIIKLYSINPVKHQKTYYISNADYIEKIYSKNNTIYAIYCSSKDHYPSNDMAIINVPEEKISHYKFEDTAEKITMSDDAALIAYLSEENGANYWKITAEDIKDWNTFLLGLKESERNEDYSRQRVAQMLDKDGTDFLNNWYSEKKTDEKTKQKFIRSLNEILKNKEFYIPKSFIYSRKIPWETKRLIEEHRNAGESRESKIRRLNYHLFELVFNNEITNKSKKSKYAIKIMDFKNNRIIQKIIDDSDLIRISTMAISPDNSMIAAGSIASDNKEGDIKIYSIKEGKLIKRLCPSNSLQEKLKVYIHEYKQSKRNPVP